MSDPFINLQASGDFNKARTKEIILRVLNLLSPENHDLLSLTEVKSLLRPKSESYRGMRVVDIDRIVGSEGRYRDFNKHFLPRYEHMRNRWERIDKAHLHQVTLPPIKLYEIGGVYFVRDGNHRVSVARQQGVQMIDAEVTSLGSEIALTPDMSREDLRRAVLKYEREQFMKATGFDRIVGDPTLVFTTPGRYDEIVDHVFGHKYYINQNRKEEIPFRDAMLSWYHNVYMPIVRAIREERILGRFPGRTHADLYVWIVKHWDELKRKYGHTVPVQQAAREFARIHGRSFARQVTDLIAGLFRKWFR